jgi:hypothetical protein
MILRWPVHDFKVELFSSIVLSVAEANIECYLTQWIIGTSWYDPMKGTVCFRNSSDICIALSVFAYIKLIPLPVSMNILSTSYAPIWALNTRGAFPGRGTVIG